MQATIAQTRRETLLASAGPTRRASVAAWVLGFAAPLYLAMRGGGYEAVLRDQVGVALWWIVLAGALVGTLPAVRPSRAQLTALGALVAFAAWTGVGALWSQSSGRTVEELARLSCYAAVLALATLAVRAQGRTALMGGVACAIGLVSVLALLSRFHPAWFPANQTAAFLSGAQSRLNYPVNYWNALAALAAMGVPLIAHFALSARRLAVRMLAAASLPVLVAVIYMTFSRGGWIELGVAAIVLLALCAGRLWHAATLAAAGAGGALLIAAIHQRPAVDQGLLSTAAARHGGNELLAVTLVVCVGVALAQGALALLEQHVEAGRALAPIRSGTLRQPRARAALALMLACTLVAGFVAASGPHALAHAWQNFKNPNVRVAASQRNSEGRLLALSGNGRYQYWVSAMHAFEGHPLEGIGAGTFQFWWAAHGSIYSYVVNAHSLYFETLAETGAPGLILLVLALGAGLVGTLRRLRGASRLVRAQLAATAAALAAFLVAAGVDWMWQIPALPATALLLMASGAAGPATGARRRLADLAWDASPASGEKEMAGGRATGDADTGQGAWIGLRARAGWILLAALGAAAIAVPMASAVSLRSSQAQANASKLSGALSSAQAARGWEPYASEPALQQALVLEQQGNFVQAAVQAARATRAAKTDWRAWLVRSRIEAEAGDPHAALVAWDRARSLDSRDPLFAAR